MRAYDDREEFDAAYHDYSDVSRERGGCGDRISSRSRRDRRDGGWDRDRPVPVSDEELGLYNDYPPRGNTITVFIAFRLSHAHSYRLYFISIL